MASNKNKTVQTNTVGWSAPPTTPDIQNLQSAAQQKVDYATPIRNSYARAEQQLTRSYNNPLGAYTTADVKDKSRREQSLALNQSEGMDLSNAAQESAQGNFNRQAVVAGMTSPQMYNASTTNAQKWTGVDTMGLITNTAGSILT